MEGQGDRAVVCRGRVLLYMSDTVWLDRCQVMVRQPTLAKFVLVGQGEICHHHHEPHGAAVRDGLEGWNSYP
jgi:hypothetical protein